MTDTPRSRIRQAVILGAFAAALLVGCQGPGVGEAVELAEAEAAAPVAAEEQARLEAAEMERAAAERERLEAEELERAVEAERDRLAAVERELAEREAQLAREQGELEAERERLALEQRERELAAREAELAERERREREYREREAAEAEAERARLAEAARLEAEAEAERLLAEEAAREPELVDATLEVGAVLEVEMIEPISSRTAVVGETFTTRVARNIHNEDGQVVIPVDSVIIGRVTEARRLKKVGGRAALGVEFVELELPDGERVAISASYIELGKDKRRDKKKIGIAAAAGAILGGILGGDAGSVAAGAAVGAAAQTAAVATRKGEDVVLHPGEILAMRLDEVVTVQTEMVGLAP